MSKGKLLQKIWDDLPEEDKAYVNKRVNELEEEYLTLQELRRTAGLTQEKLSKQLNMRQENISRLEKRSDMLLSTLRSYVEAVGGRLHLTVELPDKAPIVLSGLGDLLDTTSPVPEVSAS